MKSLTIFKNSLLPASTMSNANISTNARQSPMSMHEDSDSIIASSPTGAIQTYNFDNKIKKK
jgi:hypothetical protein